MKNRAIHTLAWRGELHDQRLLHILVRWEKYRLVYNLVLAVAVIGAAGPSTLAEAGFWSMLASRALLANLLFSVGHVVEAFVAWLGLPNRLVGVWCFTVGTTASALLAFVVAFFYGWSLD